MEAMFIIFLGVGVGYAVIGFVLGEILGCGNSSANGVSLFKSPVIATFVIVFGGAGLLLLRSFPPLTTLLLACLIGAAAAFLLYRWVIFPLYMAQNTTAIEIQSLIGHTAKVTEKIPQGKFGKITYTVNDSIYTAPAKSEDGNEIPRNASVKIIYIENHTYYVRPA